MSTENSKEHFDELLKGFDNAMLVTHDPEGELRARPMAVADSLAGGELWFATDITSGKIEEIQSDPRVVITMQTSGKYLSVTGRARLVTDRARIRALWSPTWKAWFDGADDPRLGLIYIKAREGEYWDLSGMKKKAKFLFDAVKSVFSEEGEARESLDPDISAKIAF